MTALGLVVNLIVLWNTFYLDAASNHLQQQSVVVNEQDVVHLSPLRSSHINLLGRYHLELPKSLSQGEMLPLHQSTENDELDNWEN